MIETQAGENLDQLCERINTLISEAHERGRFGNEVQVLRVSMPVPLHLWPSIDELKQRYPKATVTQDKLGWTLVHAIR